MRKAEVIAHFGSVQKAAKALRITRSAVYQWPDVLPESTAYKVQVVTDGALKVDPSVYAKSPAAVPVEPSLPHEAA